MKKKYIKPLVASIVTTSLVGTELVSVVEAANLFNTKSVSTSFNESKNDTDKKQSKNKQTESKVYYVNTSFNLDTKNLGTAEDPFNDFAYAYKKAKDGDTLMLEGDAITIREKDIPVFDKDITIDGQGKVHMFFRNTLKLEDNLTLKNLEFTFNSVESIERSIFLNGHKLTFDNSFDDIGRGTQYISAIYGGSNGTLKNSGNNAELEIITNNLTADQSISIGSIYAGGYNRDYTGNMTVNIPSKTKIYNGIYGNGKNGYVDGTMDFNIGNIQVDTFVKEENSKGTANLSLDGFIQSDDDITIKGFNDVTLNNCNMKIKDNNSENDIKGNLKLKGTTKFDVSEEKVWNVGGNLEGEENSRLIIGKEGTVNVGGELLGQLEMRTPGIAVDTSGMVSADNVYITASESSTGQVTFKPSSMQSNYSLKEEVKDGKKQWIVHKEKEEGLSSVEFISDAGSKLEIPSNEVWNELEISIVPKDSNGNELNYHLFEEPELQYPDGTIVPIDQGIDVFFSDINIACIAVIDGEKHKIPSGQYKLILTDSTTGNKFYHTVLLYRPNENIVTYDMNGGHASENINETQNETSITSGEKLTKPSDPKREGYQFTGWYTDKQATTSWDFDTNVDKSMTLYAGWEANNYQVQFDGNGATSGDMTNQTLAYGTQETLTKNAFTKTGYIFTGWIDNDGNTYTDGQSIENLTSKNNETIVLTAQWRANNYTIEFNANGGAGIMADQTVSYNKDEILTSNTYTKDGYIFLGWEDERGNIYNDGQVIRNLTDVDGETIVLTAQWGKKTKIKFDANGGIGTTMADQEIGLNQTIILDKNEYTKTGYTFAGWKWDENPDTIYNDESEFTADKLPLNNGDIVLKAQWKANTYSVKFDANGGNGTMDNQDMTYDKKDTLTTNVFTKEGYTFEGWSKTSNGSVEYKDNAEVSNLAESGSITLYAIWSQNPPVETPEEKPPVDNNTPEVTPPTEEDTQPPVVEEANQIELSDGKKIRAIEGSNYQIVIQEFDNNTNQWVDKDTIDEAKIKEIKATNDGGYTVTYVSYIENEYFRYKQAYGKDSNKIGDAEIVGVEVPEATPYDLVVDKTNNKTTIKTSLEETVVEDFIPTNCSYLGSNYSFIIGTSSKGGTTILAVTANGKVVNGDTIKNLQYISSEYTTVKTLGVSETENDKFIISGYGVKATEPNKKDGFLLEFDKNGNKSSQIKIISSSYSKNGDASINTVLRRDNGNIFIKGQNLDGMYVNDLNYTDTRIVKESITLSNGKTYKVLQEAKKSRDGKSNINTFAVKSVSDVFEYDIATYTDVEDIKLVPGNNNQVLIAVSNTDKSTDIGVINTDNDATINESSGEVTSNVIKENKISDSSGQPILNIDIENIKVNENGKLSVTKVDGTAPIEVDLNSVLAGTPTDVITPQPPVDSNPPVEKPEEKPPVENPPTGDSEEKPPVDSNPPAEEPEEKPPVDSNPPTEDPEEKPPVETPPTGDSEEKPPVENPPTEDSEEKPPVDSNPPAEKPEEKPPVENPPVEDSEEKPPVDNNPPVEEPEEKPPVDSNPPVEEPEEKPPVDNPPTEDPEEKPPVENPPTEDSEEKPPVENPPVEEPEEKPPAEETVVETPSVQKPVTKPQIENKPVVDTTQIEESEEELEVESIQEEEVEENPEVEILSTSEEDGNEKTTENTSNTDYLVNPKLENKGILGVIGLGAASVLGVFISRKKKK